MRDFDYSGGSQMKKIGIVGAGIIGASHKKAIVKNTNWCMAAVCDVVVERAVELAEGTGARVYADYQEMARCEELDAVILNLPHFLHKDVAIYFLDRGIAVLVEKPMAITTEECDEMIAAAKKSGARLAVAHPQRYFNAYRKVKDIIDTGKLGRLCIVTESRNGLYFSDKRPRWFTDKKMAGGGVAMNFGAHSLDKLFYTTGASVVNVAAVGNNYLNDADVEGAAQMLIRFSNGVGAAISFSGCYAPSQEEVVFYFTEGCAKILRRELWVSEKGEPYQKLELGEQKNVFEAQLEEFVKYLDGEPSEIVTPEYGRAVIAVVEDALRQIESGDR